MTNSLVASLARAQVRPLPAYNAGLSNEAVRARYGVTDIARLASNETLRCQRLGAPGDCRGGQRCG
jgi:hypothetical protein